MKLPSKHLIVVVDVVAVFFVFDVVVVVDVVRGLELEECKKLRG